MSNLPDYAASLETLDRLAARREMRSRRDKIAALVFVEFLRRHYVGISDTSWQDIAKAAAEIADCLIAELDRTAKDLTKPEAGAVE